MKSFEFILEQKNLIDVHLDIKKIQAESGCRIYEDVDSDKEYLKTLFDETGISEVALIKGEYFFPLATSISYHTKQIWIWTVMTTVEFITLSEGYAYFSYDGKGDRPIRFPTDDVLLDNQRCFIFRDKSTVDKFLTTLMLRFSNVDHWELIAKAYDSSGDLRRISNIR